MDSHWVEPSAKQQLAGKPTEKNSSSSIGNTGEKVLLISVSFHFYSSENRMIGKKEKIFLPDHTGWWPRVVEDSEHESGRGKRTGSQNGFPDLLDTSMYKENFIIYYINLD